MESKNEIIISLISIAINILNIIAVFTNIYSPLTGLIITTILLIFAYRKQLIGKPIYIEK